LQKMAEYGDAPDLGQMFTLRAAPEAPQGNSEGGQDQGGGMKPPQTTRNYVRRSEGQDSKTNQNAQLMNSLSQGAMANQKANVG
jgi:hypothetical protein